MSTSFFDYEKVNNALIKTIKLPQFESTLNAVIEKKAVILVPHSASLEGEDISKYLIACHIALKNPSNENELLTINGLCCVIEMKGESKFIHVISEKQRTEVDDTVMLFKSKRNIFDGFSVSYNRHSLIRQTVQILREGEILLKKKLVPIVLIAEPITYPGCAWGKEKSIPQGGDAKGTFSSWFFNSEEQNSKDAVVIEMSQEKSSNSIPSSTSNTKPSNFRDLFYLKIKNIQASDISQNMRDFVDGFSKDPPLSVDQGKIVLNFLNETMKMIQSNPLWKGASMEELDEAYECLEKSVMVKIYKYCFSPNSEDLARDKKISKRIKQLNWLTPDHLDIRIQHRNERRFKTAISELLKIDSYKAPRDKMICILNCSKALFSIFHKASKEGHPAKADEFLPLLIYTVVNANPPRFHSNLDYIQRFRKESKLITESGYYLTHLVSTISFLENINASQIKISPQEFDRLMGETTPNEKPNEVAKDSNGLLTPIEVVSQPSLQSICSSSKEKSIKRVSSRSHSKSFRTKSSTSKGPKIETNSHISSIDSWLKPISTNRDESFYQSYQLEIETKHFLSCNADDLRIGDIPNLLFTFKMLVEENKRIKEELATIKNNFQNSQNK